MAFGKFQRLAKQQEQTPQKDTEKKPVVVVVDDDIHIRHMLALILQKKYEVRLCENGEQGIQNVDAEVHVVILDIKMPGKDGFQVYHEIQPRFPNLPIIFFSAYQNILEGAKLSLKYKPFNYIDKGTDIKELLESVDRAVESYKRILSMDSLVERVQSVPKVKAY